MKRSERKNQMRERILQIASERYLKTDPEEIRMRELARIIGISSATLYKYFSSKDELSRAVVMQILTQYQKIIMDDLNDPARTFPEILQRMQRFSRQASANMNRKTMDLFFQMYQDSNEMNQLFDSRNDFWRQFIARGRADGCIADDLSDTAVFIYIDMFYQYFRDQEHMDKFNMTPELWRKIDHELDAMFYRGLLGTGADGIKRKTNPDELHRH